MGSKQALHHFQTAERPFVVYGLRVRNMSFLEEPKTNQLRQIAEAVVKDNFLELFDLVVRPQGKKLHLTVVLDKKSGVVTLDECTMVSRELEKRLDELDLIGPAY